MLFFKHLKFSTIILDTEWIKAKAQMDSRMDKVLLARKRKEKKLHCYRFIAFAF